MFLSSLFMPARAQAQHDQIPDVKIVCDFDSVLSQRVGFKFQGRVYQMEPVTVENYMKVTLAYRDLLDMAQGRAQGVAMKQDEIYLRYFELIHPLVPEFSYETLKQLPFTALNQLINLVIKNLSGDNSYLNKQEVEKKNTSNQLRS